MEATAQVSIPAASSMQLAGGTLNLAGTDLQVGGSLSLGSGNVVNATNVSILAGGLIDAGSGALHLVGNWSNLGNFAGGTSTVFFTDGGLTQSVFTGSTTFASASFISTTGKSYIFPVGLTQSFTTALTVLGTATKAIAFRSATPGQAAFVDLFLPSGIQDIDFVAVSNVHSTGEILAPTKTNDGGAGDDAGWFSSAIAAAIAAAPAPMLSTFALLLLALVLFGVARRRLQPGSSDDQGAVRHAPS
jgi:hypothetical protein